MQKRLRSLIRRIASGSRFRATPEASPPRPNINVLDAIESGWFRTESGELFEGFPIHAEDHVLDVGCGDGPYIDFCAHRGAEVTFADIDAEKVSQVEARLKGSPARAVHPLVCDANPLPLPDSSVDKIIAMEVMEHVESPERFLAELFRVGKPGALYLLTVPGAVSESVQKSLAPSAYFQRPNHINVFTEQEFESAVTASGLIIQQQARYGFFASVWWAFFWTCKQDLSEPSRPLLASWEHTWDLMLQSPDGPRIKRALDNVMPKSQAIIARKPQRHLTASDQESIGNRIAT